MKTNYKCSGCDWRFTIIFSEDDSGELPNMCPFCGDYIGDDEKITKLSDVEDEILEEDLED